MIGNRHLRLTTSILICWMLMWSDLRKQTLSISSTLHKCNPDALFHNYMCQQDGSAASCPVTCTDCTGWLHLTEALGRDCGNREKPIRENRGQTPVTESGWGEVLGLYVSQHAVWATKPLHQLSSRAHIVPALWLWVSQFETAVLSKCSLSKRKTVALTFKTKKVASLWFL